MKRGVRISIIAFVPLLALGTAAWWYLRTSNTRLTPEPPIIGGLLPGAAHLPKRPRSVVIIIEENKTFEKIIDEPERAPYIVSLAKDGAVFTHSYGIAHPSQPNYFALFAGATDGNGDKCPALGIAPTAPNLASELLAEHRSFRAYAEDLPAPGYLGCASGEYARKHAPWTNFSNIPAAVAVPFSTLTSYDALPNVAFIIPNLLNDMHSASIERGDRWLKTHIDPLVRWAKKHETLIVLTWDESDRPVANHIPTIFIGPMVKPGRYDEQVNHYRVLRTVEELFALPHAGFSAAVAPITDIWLEPASGRR